MIEWLFSNFDTIAGWCSVLGLIISIFVLSSVRRIRKTFQLKARTPEITKQLSEFSKDLNSYIEDVEKYKNEIVTISKRLEYTLKSLRGKSSSELVKNIDISISRIKRIKKGGTHLSILLNNNNWSFKEETWELYSDIQGILQGIKELSKDSHWSEQ